MNDRSHLEPDDPEFVEVDPTGRYGRYSEILGKGASKTVYRAFDEYEGIEVAWNQIKLYDFLRCPEDLERLYSEIHLLKTLKHKNIMKFYTSWVDTSNRNINFVTEMFTSGTLRQYRLKHRRVNIRAVKHWCRQILKGLLYLHSHDPPVIHRDLKCDNIFVNGNQGEVKIGDLGLAAILRKSFADHCVGTPEFMAPEVYEEAYNELVDIYSFGMCILEMVTFEYPYSECTHPAQIYKKVISGKKPDALYRVMDPEVKQFVEKCLATVSLRLSARELLNDPFLQIEDCEYESGSLNCGFRDVGPTIRQPFFDLNGSKSTLCNGVSDDYNYFDASSEWGYSPAEVGHSGIELFERHDDGHYEDVDISIKGKRRENGDIFLRLRITDKDGLIRNIYFPFDVEIDTALSVATEMVAELDYMDQDVTRIADMIDGEIASMVPQWRLGPGMEDSINFSDQTFCQNCASNRTSYGSLMEYLTTNSSRKNLEVYQCCKNGCATTHGRFEEITFQATDGSENDLKEPALNVSSQSNCLNYHDTLGGHEFSSASCEPNHSEEEHEETDRQMSKSKTSTCSGSFRGDLAAPAPAPALDNFEQESQQKLRWLKANFQMKLRALRDRHLRHNFNKDCGKPPIAEDMAASNGFCNASVASSNSMHRTLSLPVDAVHL